MRKANYNLAMIQGTRWNLAGSITAGDYQVNAAPAAKTSADAHAGVCIIIDHKIAKNTQITYDVTLEHRILQVRLHSTKYDVSIIAAYAPGEHSSHQTGPSSGPNSEKP